MKNITATITVQNKKYQYTLTKKGDSEVYIECSAAKIAQDFPTEDIAELLIDLPNLIIAEKEYQASQSDVVRFRVSPEDKNRIEKQALTKGFSSVSEYLRNLALHT